MTVSVVVGFTEAQVVRSSVDGGAGVGCRSAFDWGGDLGLQSGSLQHKCCPACSEPSNGCRVVYLGLIGFRSPPPSLPAGSQMVECELA